jgi:DNA-binding NarL/FixJ family response regulator
MHRSTDPLACYSSGGESVTATHSAVAPPFPATNAHASADRSGLPLGTISIRSGAATADHPLVRGGLVSSLPINSDFNVVQIGDDAHELLALVVSPDLVPHDLELDGVLALLSAATTMIVVGSLVLVVGAVSSPSQVQKLMRFGDFFPWHNSADASGEVIDTVVDSGHSTSPELETTPTPVSDEASADRPNLSEREQKVLVLYASGLKLASVARQLEISPHTCKEYLDRVRAKYAAAGRQASTKIDLYREAVRDGFIDPAAA